MSEQTHEFYDEVFHKTQELARRCYERIRDKNKRLRLELKCKISDLDLASKKLDELASKSISQERTYEDEKEQKEKQVALLFHMLERELNAKQKLELETTQLESKLEAVKPMQGEDSESKKKMAEQSEELQEKYDRVESIARTLITKEGNVVAAPTQENIAKKFKKIGNFVGMIINKCYEDLQSLVVK